MTMTKFNLIVNIEVSEDKGEDANLAEDFGQNFLMGVFDGLGGRSAGYEGKTGGRIASEEASKISRKFFTQWSQITSKNLLLLQKKICESLKTKADTYMPKTSSRLKGSLVEHRLCTTIALARILKQQTQEKIFEADVAWMGDSRIYFLSPTKGLQQLTKDNLVSPKDAFEILRDDPPMSQYLTADINPKWQICFQHYTFEEIGCFLACTDGCFQYFSAPWEFEKLLLDTLIQSEGEKVDNNNWKTLMEKKYLDIKQDDISLILYPVGFNGIKHLKNSYQSRWEYLQDNFIVSQGNTSYEDLKSLWEDYRINYEYYLQSIQDFQPIIRISQSTDSIANTLSLSTDAPMSGLSKISDSIINSFQGLNQSFKQKADVKAEKIKKLLDIAYSKYEEDRLEQAKNFCDQVLAIDSYDMESKYLLGLICTKSGFYEQNFDQKQQHFQQAVRYLIEVIRNDGEKLIESCRTIGFIYYHLNQWKESVKFYQQSFKYTDAEKLEAWEEHLEAFVTSIKLINAHDEEFTKAIQFCQNLANILPYGKNAYPYYFMAVLQEIKIDLLAAWNSIQIAKKIYSSNHFESNYKIWQKIEQKYQEINNKLNNYR